MRQEELVRAAKAGDAGAFTELYKEKLTVLWENIKGNEDRGVKKGLFEETLLRCEEIECDWESALQAEGRNTCT